jgi:multisubunit Na+/H+ antiporter MnhC subunit
MSRKQLTAFVIGAAIGALVYAMVWRTRGGV